MGFRTVVVNNHSKLSYKNNHLVYKSATEIQLIHLPEIDLLLMETTDIVITTMLMSKLMEHGIGVIFCDSKRLPAAQIIPYYGRHDSSLTLSKQMNWQEDTKDLLAYNLLQQKIHNQSEFLASQGFADKAQAVHDLGHELALTDPSNREGHAARIFFNTLYGNQFSREDNCDINAGLDYGYTLVMSLFAREIVKCGCLSQLGINHRNQFNPFNLASDLMEPFRWVVDQVVYSHRDKGFDVTKRQLVLLFARTYHYNNTQMYLNNIVATYVKQCIDYLHGDGERIPVFTVT